jgi:hypothetical protein
MHSEKRRICCYDENGIIVIQAWIPDDAKKFQLDAFIKSGKDLHSYKELKFNEWGQVGTRAVITIEKPLEGDWNWDTESFAWTKI